MKKLAIALITILALFQAALVFAQPSPSGIPRGTTRADGSPHQDGDILRYRSAYLRWVSEALATGGGSFITLSDAPASYATFGGYLVRVNAGATGLEFLSPTTYLPLAGNAASATKSTNLIGGNGTTLLGAVPYQSGTDTTSFVNNVTTTRKFLREVGDGTNSTAPVFDTLQSGDIPSLSATYIPNIISTDPTTGNYTPFIAADVRTAPAGGVTQYQLVYQTGTASVVDLAKADSASTMRCIGMAVATAGAGAPVTILSDGLITYSGWSWTPGAELYVDPSTAGLLTATKPPTVGQQVQAVARAKTATTIRMLPNQPLIEVGLGGADYLAGRGSGTAYTLTATPALITLGTTNPVIDGTSTPFAAGGVYLIRAYGSIQYAGATFISNRVITLKVRRTSGTPADLTNSSTIFNTGVLTTLTLPDIGAPLQEFLYTATATTDVLQVWGSIDVIPSVGAVNIVNAWITAQRIY